MNIVVDTNVLISGLLWKGQSFKVLKAILERHTLVAGKRWKNLKGFFFVINFQVCFSKGI